MTIRLLFFENFANKQAGRHKDRHTDKNHSTENTTSFAKEAITQ